MKSTNPVVPFPRPVARRRDLELAFLPAALEIVETPPSPVGRAIVFVIISVFCLAIAWASWGTIDIIATAQGKIVPSGRSKVIQPFDTGVVRAIHVTDGQHVHAGDLLIELDPTMDRAEQEHLHSDLVAAQTRHCPAPRRAERCGRPIAEFHPPADANPALVANERQLLIDETTEQRAKLAALDRQAAEKAAERATAGATIDKIAAEIPLQQQRVDMRKTLVAKGLESKILYLQEAQDLIANQKELLVQQSHKNEAEAAFQALIEQRAQAVFEYRHSLADDLVKADAKAAGLTQDLIKAARKTGLQRLTAPVDGTVQQLAVHTVGGVVTPAQPLAGRRAGRQPSRDRGDGVEPRHRLRPSRPGRRDQDRHLQLHPLRPAAWRSRDCVAGRDQPRQAAGRAQRAADRADKDTAASTERARSSSMPRASRSTGPQCRSTTSWSTSPPAWR